MANKNNGQYINGKHTQWTIHKKSFLMSIKFCIEPLLAGESEQTLVCDGSSLYTLEKYFLIVNLNKIWIVITLYNFFWHQLEFCLVPNHSELCNYNPNLV